MSDPNAPPAPDDTRFGELANIRATYGREMANNPVLRQQLMATTHAEVGTDNDAAQQALIETVFNRAAARKMTLEQALHSIHQPPDHPIKNDPGYWDYRTGIAQQKPVDPDVQARLNPMIDRALAGSNVSAFSTGNQSPDPKLKMFTPRFDPQQKSRDTFGVEEQKPDLDWFKGKVLQQKQWNDQGQPVTPDVGPVNALKDVPKDPPSAQPAVRRALPIGQPPRAMPVVKPLTETDTDSDGAIAQADTDDESDPAYHWPDA